ncbi:MAG: hypothetical protein GX962_07160 [Epulopiscium sp.]|nr:hypothetical protein [Candidatus Epulonipiscium sp.]
MKKYIKYEIKGSYKFVFGIIAIIILASTMIQLNISKTMELSEAALGLGGNLGFTPFILIISILVIFGAFLTAFFYIIGSFRKELYEDRGYLTFTLPLTGNQVVGAKFIVAMIWFTVLGLVVAIYNLIFASLLFSGSWLESVRGILELVNEGVLALGVTSILSSIMTLALIYFTIALSRVSIRNKKIGGLWFILFLVLNGLTGYLTFKISAAFPYFLSANSFRILHYNTLDVVANLNNDIGNIILFGRNYDTYLNIAGLLIQIIISVGAFLSTGYLIEKKIDL